MRKPIIIPAIIFIAALSVNACNNQATEKKESASSPKLSNEELVKKGEHLVAVLDCEICHSPKKMGPNGPELIPEQRFGGHQNGTQLPPTDEKILKSGWVLFAPDFTSYIGPWGQTFARNISSDSTGIGMWKLEQFKKVLREGKFMGLDNTRPIMPPMPWDAYRHLDDDDIEAVFAFLKSTKPVNNRVPDAKLNPPPKN